MAHTIELTMQNCETVLPKGKREILTIESPYFVPCSINEHEDNFVIVFNVKGLIHCSEIQNRSLQEKYRFLYNCSCFMKIAEEYRFTITPDNIYYDINLLPRLLKKDVGVTEKEKLLLEYKALIGTILLPKYSFDDYIDGGKDLYLKNKFLKTICIYHDSAEVVEAVLRQYLREEENNTKNTVAINKKKLTAFRILIPLLTVITVVCTLLFSYYQLYKLPFENRLISANNYYLANNYLAVQSELEAIDVQDLPPESKYILARSYVISESLNASQKENILSVLLIQTDTIYFDYWINLGRLNFDAAIDCAQRIGDDELLLFAYIKYVNFLESDIYTMSGEEKAEKIDDLKKKIEALSSQMENQQDEILSDTP